MDQLEITIIGAILNGVSLAVGMIIGTRLTGNVMEKTIKRIMSKSPTFEKVAKMLEMSDKLFGDNQAVEQITGFFKEARDLVSSPEARNFFTNITKLMKQLGEEETGEKVEIDLPTLPGAADDKGGDKE